MSNSRPSLKPGKLIDRLDPVIAELNDALKVVWLSNGGRVAFLMDRGGHPQSQPSEARTGTRPYTFADLFTAKGFAAAARYRGDLAKEEESYRYIEAIGNSILDCSFQSGQVDPRNPNVETKNLETRQQGPGMIYLGSLAAVAGISPPRWALRFGIEVLARILDAHVASDRSIANHPNLRRNDLWEAVAANDTPYIDDGKTVSDPGHSIEFVGLASRYIRLFTDAFPPDSQKFIETLPALLPEILFRNFDNGFRPDVGGITKTIALITRMPVDAHLPWWSLPETMRSAMEVHRLSGNDPDRHRCREIFARAHNAFITHYVRPGDDRVPDLWYQSRNANGRVVDVIPACPDIDPGYHTNMSILEALELAELEAS